jgi:hypothetical protein
MISSKTQRHGVRSLMMMLRQPQQRSCTRQHYYNNHYCDPRSSSSSNHYYSCYRSYFTNGQVTKKNDPYAILGLQWGDGATSTDIKQAFREKARKLHPDVNQEDSPEVALKKFQELQKAYESLMKAVTNEDLRDIEEWRIAIWRQGDRIAMDRTDVAGVKRKRPVQPTTTAGKVYSRELGHPDGRGVPAVARAEYLGEGRGKKSSSVGTGRSKWVKPKEFRPWNGGEEK